LGTKGPSQELTWLEQPLLAQSSRSRNGRLWNCRLAQNRGKHARKRAGRWPSAPRWGQVARDHARKTNHRGIGRVAADFVLNLIAYNVIRIPKLMAA
jgi:hypothetical protein